MSWRGEKGGIAAAQAGHDVVMAPTGYTYLDYYQGPKESEPLGIGGMVTLDKVYSFEPIPKELSAAEARHVLGGQGQLWTEYLADGRQVEYMAFPRACALAEVLWSPADSRNFDAFRGRLAAHLQRLSIMDVNYRKLDAPNASQPHQPVSPGANKSAGTARIAGRIKHLAWGVVGDSTSEKPFVRGWALPICRSSARLLTGGGEERTCQSASRIISVAAPAKR